jgi:hypothetical protein
MFEKRVVRRIFEPERVEVTSGWRKLHNIMSFILLGLSNQGGLEWQSM